MRWSGGQAVAALPEQFGLRNVDSIREQLLALINRGATTLIVDMTATLSCDHAATEALARVYRRAAANGTELRLVITAPVIRRIIALSGLDRLIPIYPILPAAQFPDSVLPCRPRRPAPDQTVLRRRRRALTRSAGSRAPIPPVSPALPTAQSRRRGSGSRTR